MQPSSPMTREQLEGAVMALERLKNHRQGGDYRPHVAVRDIDLIIGALRADLAAMPPQPDLPEFDDARVATVYRLLCSNDAPPNKEEHWEGWVARQIVQAIGTKPQPDLRAALVEARAALDTAKAELLRSINQTASGHHRPRNEREREAMALCCGEGYGNMMAILSTQWHLSVGGGAFLVGTCLATAHNQVKDINAAMARIDAALGEEPTCDTSSTNTR